jgi:mannan endo-1,4-beta-mannosidase
LTNRSIEGNKRSLERRSYLIAAVAMTICGATSMEAAAARQDFVYREGRNLMLNGQVYRFVGVNAFGLTGCRTGSPDSQATMDAYFGSLRPQSVTRTWAFRPQGVEGIERAVRTAEQHGQKLILALTDGAGYCGDSDGRVGGEGTFKSDAWYRGDYRGAYFDWIRTVVPKYKDSPAIAMWEIANEPKGNSAAVTDAVMKSFFDETAALIKSLDPNHLVSSGSQAQYLYGTSDFSYVHSGPNIDVASVHEYDYAYQDSRTIVSGHFTAAKAKMDQLGKPLYIGETGVGLSYCMSAQERSDGLRQKYDAYLRDGSVGILYWGWASNPDNGCSPYTGAADGPGSPLMAMTKSYVIDGAPPPPSNVYDDAVFSYEGSWLVGLGPDKYLGADRYSSQAGASYSLNFVGKRVRVYAARAPHHGIVAVSIDGGPERMVDMYSPVRAEQQMVFRSPLLTSGRHVLKVRVTGNKNSASTGVVGTADKVVVGK